LTRPGFQIVARNNLSLIQSAALAGHPWLIHGFSLRYAHCAPDSGAPRRQAREFNLGLTHNAQRNEVERNRLRFVRALGPAAISASLHQIHSAAVWEVRRKRDSAGHTRATSPVEYRPGGWPLPGPAAARVMPAGDALITAEPGVLLTIRTADCLPVLVADRRLRWVAAIHAGWRGALARVIEKTIGELRRIAGSGPEDLLAVLGPGIGRCCYEVGGEVIDAFRGQFRESDAFFHKPVSEGEPQRSELRYTLLFHTQAPPGHRREGHGLHLDLNAVARAQLVSAGVSASAIHASEYCTACRPDLFFSHRRDGERAGRMLAAIGVRESK
jgi:polyphenol oxidase